jgi:hypothetical protein
LKFTEAPAVESLNYKRSCPSFAHFPPSPQTGIFRGFFSTVITNLAGMSSEAAIWRGDAQRLFGVLMRLKCAGAHSAQSCSAVKAHYYIYNSVHYLQGMSTCLRTVCLMFELLRKSVLFRCKRAFTEDPHECKKSLKHFLGALLNKGGFSCHKLYV